METLIEFGIGRRAFKSSRKAVGCRLASAALWAGLVTAPLFCQGCLVLPVRAPTRTYGSSGALKKINLDFIQAGKTTREEVTAKLGGTDTGIEDKQIFLGRWTSSKWGVLWMVSDLSTNAAGGFERGWARHNVLIGFDDKDVVQQYRQFPDGELVKQLSAWLAQGQGQPLDLSTPIEVPVEHRHSSGREFSGTFILGNDLFAFHEYGAGKDDFKISPKQIKELSLTSIGHGDKSDPRYMNQTLHFTQKTKVGGKMTIRVNVPTVLILVKYLAQTRSSQQPPNRNPAENNSSVSAGPPIAAFTR
jgi:hypothetical protein